MSLSEREGTSKGSLRLEASDAEIILQAGWEEGWASRLRTWGLDLGTM